MTAPHIELVTWTDASSDHDWSENDVAIARTTNQKLTAYAVGYVIADTFDRLVLAQCRNHESYAMMMTIPAEAIVNRKVLKGAEK